MFTFLRGTFTDRLHLLTSVKICTRSFHRASFSFQQVLFSRTGDLRQSRYAQCNLFQIQQTRNLSKQDLSEYSMSIYKYVNTTYVSENFKTALIDFHNTTGLPWWATIVLTAATVKCLISLPAGAFQQYTMTRIHFTREEVEKTFKNTIEPEILLSARRGKWKSGKTARKLYIARRKLWNSLVVKNNCHPSKIIILSLAQFPIWVFLSYSLRDILDVKNTAVPVLEKLALQTEGVLWNTNLCVPDATMILPLTFFISSWILIDINSFSPTSVGSLLSKVLKTLFKLFSIFGLFVGIIAPAGLTLYWSSSLIFGLIINLALLSPRLRRFFRIPITPKESLRPYSELIKKFKDAYLGFFKRFHKTQS